MTTYHIKKINCIVDSTKGDGTQSDPPFFKLYNASTLTGYVPNMINTTQYCFNFMESITNKPFQRFGYGQGVNENYTEVSISKTTGQYIVISSGDDIFISNDYGVSWRTEAHHLSGCYCSCVISYDGSKVFASAHATYGNTSKYSSDYGVTWSDSNSTADGLRNLCMSSDGSKVVGHSSGGLYRSTNYGSSFTQISSDTTITGVCCSSDGARITYTTDYGKIYVSTDSGANFTARGLDKSWKCVCMSSDGSTQYAGQEPGDSYGTIYKSTDSGTSWSYLADSTFISDIDCTSDGSMYGWVGLLLNRICFSGDGSYIVKTVLEYYKTTNYYISHDSGSNFIKIDKNTPKLYEINNIGGDYGFALDLKRINYNEAIDWNLQGWRTPYTSEIYTEDTFANELCDYFEESKIYISGYNFFSDINLYLIICTVNGDSDPENICYIPIFYFGNNPSDADRTYTP